MPDKDQTALPPNFSVFSKLISYQINTWTPLSRELSIEETLLEIKSNKHEQKISILRNILGQGKKDEYSIHKRTLPAVTFCGTFDGERKKINLKTYNSVIVLDIDKLSSDELTRCKHYFLNDKSVYAFWESPSKEGLKGLVLLHFNFELNFENIDKAHKSAFQKLASHFKELYNIELDKSGSDTTRLCFFSYDPYITIKENVIPFEIYEEDFLVNVEHNEKIKSSEIHKTTNRDNLYNPISKNKPKDRYTIAAIIKFLEKKKLSITHSYEEWYKLAMAIANTFTYDVGEKYFLKLSSLDEEKYDSLNCKNFLANCYQRKSGAINFSTIVYFANEKNYKTKKQRERGSGVIDESLSQVSSSNTVTKVRLPEDLKK